MSADTHPMAKSMRAPAPSSRGAGACRAGIRAANRRTALVLAFIAAVFFSGIIVAQYTGATGVGLTVLGFAIMGYLVLAIGRHVRR